MAETTFERLPDYGPRYTETPQDVTNFTGVAEPYNTITASLFVFIVLYWVIRLRGNYRSYPMLSCCLPLLFVGGVGGTLYHGLRSSPIYFLMDVIPIYLLGMVVSIWLAIRLRLPWLKAGGLIVCLCVMQLLGHRVLPKHWAINLSYANLGVIILIPILLVAIRTRFQSVSWMLTALVSFGFALFCRQADTPTQEPLLPMGTHWLWHTFGALTTFALSEYIYRVERADVGPGAGHGQSNLNAEESH